ncbi:response regulator [candidate division KSB1 bacterium]|nr:response regulator [candidate division KSB1 bacterium]
MNKKHVLLVDVDSNNLDMLSDHFFRSNINIDQVSSNAQAFEKIEHHRYDAVLTEIDAEGVDGYKILSKVQKVTRTPKPAVLFLTKKSDIWHKQKSLKLGAKDYIVKPIHAREIVARTKMILRRLEKTEQKFSGNLENLKLVQLIETFGIQKKSGTLSLSQNGSNGRILFSNGVVISARFHKLAAEDAIYKMMSWQQGHFAMDFHPVEEPDEIRIGNLGLLLQGAKIMDERQKLLHQLPPLDAVLMTTTNFQKIVSSQEMEPELEHFVNLFDGHKTLKKILQKSEMDEINLLKRIVKLYDLGFLYVPKDSSVEPESAPDTDTADIVEETGSKSEIPEYPVLDSENFSDMDNDPFSIFRQAAEEDDWQLENTEKKDSGMVYPPEKSPHPADELLKVPEQHEEEPHPIIQPAEPQKTSVVPKSENHILILSNQPDLGTRFIETLVPVSRKPSDTKDSTPFSCGVINIKNKYSLNLLGLPLGKEFDPVIERLKDSLIGILLLIDESRANFNYLRYLLRALETINSFPVQIAFISPQDPAKEPNIDRLCKKLNVENHEQVNSIAELEKNQIKTILKSLLKTYAKRQQKQ